MIYLPLSDNVCLTCHPGRQCLLDDLKVCNMLHAVGVSLTCSFMVLTINSIFEQFDPLSPEDRDQCCVSLEQEAILSYHFLFGQYGNSKKVACEKLCSLKNECRIPKSECLFHAFGSLRAQI